MENPKTNITFVATRHDTTMMYAAISADIVSSTTLTPEETIALKQRIEDLFSTLENKYHGFWGRLIKGDYIECLIPSATNAFRIALLIKTCIKSFPINEQKDKKPFATYGTRIAIGIGQMRIIDREQGIMDGEAIYLSGRALNKIGSPTKRGTMQIDIAKECHKSAMQAIGTLTDALLNNATRKQSAVLHYKLLGYNEREIAHKLGLTQSAVNQHSTSAQWYCIEEALKYFEQLNFEERYTYEYVVAAEPPSVPYHR